tara:strand:- start:1660 stop:2178 length:519 start_codon:yes stop_codon:yes gene_type:complete
MANVLGFAKVAANLTGRQINTLLSRLGMDKNILKGMNEKQKKLALADVGKKHIKNMRQNTNTRVGTTALVLGPPAAYGIADMVHDFLGITKLADGTMLKETKTKKTTPKPLRRKVKAKTKPDPRKDKQIALPKQKPKKPKSKVTPPKPKPKLKPKKKQNGVKFVFETKKKGK